MRHLSFIVIVLALVSACFAEEAKPRYVVTVPPGYKLVEVARHKAICLDKDEAWVRTALGSLTPTTKPTTMPADLVTRLDASRQSVIGRIATDFAVADTAAIAGHFDKLAEQLKSLQAFDAPFFYLCATPDEIKAILKNGAWSTPGLYYNRAADDVSMRQRFSLTTERPMDDTVIPVLLPGREDAKANIDRLQRRVAGTDGEIAELLAGRGMFLCQASAMEAVLAEVFLPMKLDDSQRWFEVGLAGAKSADYAAEIIGCTQRELLVLIAAELRANPVKPSTIDVLHPAPSDALNPQYVPLYADAFRRKSIGIALTILDSADGKLPQLVSSVRDKRPATGEELVARIREITGVDVSSQVGRK